jgi:hypothetical protein
MSDFRETRTSVASWNRILIPTYKELIGLGAGGVWVYGSQAMSLYMKRPFASRDLDFLVSGLTLDMVRAVCKTLAPLSGQRAPYFDFKNPEHDGKPNPVFGIYLNAQDEKPFALELFQTYNAQNIRELTPYAEFVSRWKSEFQTLSVEAIIGTRLGFRPPERITPFNAQRLNLFIKTVRDRIVWSKVEEFAKKFHLEERINENLIHLRRKKIQIIDCDKLSFVSLL